MKLFMLICFVLLTLMLLFLAVYLIVGAILYRLILTRKGKMLKKIEALFENDKEEGIFDRDFKKVSITSADNLKLCGFYKDNSCGRVVLLVHGYGGNHRHMAKYVKLFEKKGYDILAIDMRSHGESEGRDITMGKKESEDLKLWIEKLLQLKNHYKIVLFGVSLGASSVCLAAGEQLPSNVVLAIEDSGFDNADKELKFMFLQHKIISKLCYNIFYNYTKKSQELDLKKVDVTSKIKNSRLPILFIHGDSDKIVPTEMVYNLSSQVPDNRKDTYIGKDSGHVGSYKNNAYEYERVVNGFLSKYNM